MYQLRPRFGLPRFGQQGPETPENGALGVPAAPLLRRPSSRIAVCLAAGVLALGACSTSDEPTAADGTEQPGDASNDGDATTDGASGTDLDGTAELSFGDPAEVGFDGVEEDDPEPVETSAAEREVLSAPEEVIEEVAAQIEAAPEVEEILDAVGEIDGNNDVATDRDGRSRNSSGELAILDEAANLACAHVEIALTHLDDGNDSIAIERIWSAADRAGNSEIAAVREWQEPLSAVIAEGTVSDITTLVGFITVCAEGGYEL